MSLDKLFNIENANNLPVVVKTNPEIIIDTSGEKDEDYRYARTTYKNLIGDGKNAISDLTTLARDLSSPRAYEVLAKMIQTVSETTDKLFELQKKNKEINDIGKPKKLDDEGKILIDKAVFVGTSAEMLEKKRKELLSNVNTETNVSSG